MTQSGHVRFPLRKCLHPQRRNRPPLALRAKTIRQTRRIVMNDEQHLHAAAGRGVSQPCMFRIAGVDGGLGVASWRSLSIS
jgi:hypothetical protein